MVTGVPTLVVELFVKQVQFQKVNFGMVTKVPTLAVELFVKHN